MRQIRSNSARRTWPGVSGITGPYSGAVTHAGSFNGNTMAAAAVLASIDELASGEVYEQVGKIGTALMQSIRDCAQASHLDLHVQGLPMAFHAEFRGAWPGHDALP